MDNHKLKPPKPGRGDAAFAAAKVASSAIPAVGGSAAAILEAILAPPLTKRLEEWRESVAEAIRELRARVKGLSPDKLQNNPAFISAVAYATQAAIRTHQEEKREALRNAVLHVALGSEIDEDSHLVFLNLVDALTPGHITILRAFSGSESARTATFRRLTNDRALFDLMVRDLLDRGLVGLAPHLVARGPNDLYRINPQVPVTLELLGSVTDLGKRFLAFISPAMQ